MIQILGVEVISHVHEDDAKPPVVGSFEQIVRQQPKVTLVGT